MKPQIESAIQNLNQALIGTSSEDRGIISNQDAPGLIRGAIVQLTEIIPTAGAMHTMENQAGKVKELSEKLQAANKRIAELEAQLEAPKKAKKEKSE